MAKRLLVLVMAATVSLMGVVVVADTMEQSGCSWEQESNNDVTVADSLDSGCRQGSISPVGDADWYYFNVSGTGSIHIETTTSGDTEIYLYNSSLSLLASDDDSGVGYGSLIVRSLGPGTYFVQVVEHGYDSTVSAYELRVR